MSKSKTFQQIIIILLFILMTVGTTTVLVRAETSELPIDESSDIATYEELAVDNVAQSVSIGASEADMEQPETVDTNYERDEVRDFGDDLLESEEDSNEPATEMEKIAAHSIYKAITNWDTLQDEIDRSLDGDVIDLSGLSTPKDGKAYTFIVGKDKTLTFKGNGTRIGNLAFVFQGNNTITIENLNINSANNHMDNSKIGYSPLHFTGTDNILILKGTNTVISGQTTHVSSYGAGIGVPFGAEITISNESDGVIYVKSGLGGAGIGGGYASAGGEITIAGGTITTSGGNEVPFWGGAGVGGGTLGAGGNITITGGKVTSKGGTGGAGIGGGIDAAGGNITITGGTVYSTGGTLGAGIGGGGNGAGGNIIIAGGSVGAFGQDGSNSIGAGMDGTGGTLKNSNGDDIYLNTLTIPGKVNTAITAGSINGVACTNGMPTAGAYGIKDVTTDASGKVYFYLPISGNSGSTKEIIRLTAGPTTGYILYARSSRVVEKTLSLLDSFPKDWDEVQFYVNFSSLDTINLSELSTPGDGVVYTFHVNRGRTFTLKSNGKQIENVAFVFEGNNTITIEDLNLKSADNHVDTSDSSKKGFSPLYFTGKGNFLFLKGTNTVINGQTTLNRYYGAGLGNSLEAELTVNTVDGDTVATLNAVGGYMGAGIGNADFVSSKDIINIFGGRVNATGGTSAPGIGGNIINISSGTVNAFGDSAYSGIGPGYGGYRTTVNISGGTVTATGGARAAGIGDGYHSAYSKVRISGGTVTATGGENSVGIGGYGTEVSIYGGMVTATGGSGSWEAGGAGIGYDGGSGRVSISGGTVNAIGGIGDKDPFSPTLRYLSGPGIGGKDNIVIISGGSVNAKGGIGAQDIDGTLINGVGTAVFLNTLTLTNAINIDITSGSINGTDCVENEADGIAYGIRAVKTDADGKVYFYLPISDDKEMVSLTVDGVVYSKSYQRFTDDNTHNLLPETVVTVTAPRDIFYGQLLGDPNATAKMGGNKFIYSYSGIRGTSYGPTETKPLSAGSYVITATLVSETHWGTGTAEFYILPKALKSDMLTFTKSSTYNGVEQTADFTVADGSTILALDTDYENVSYSNNIKAGTATLTITGKSNYSGTVSKNFHIEKAQLTATAVAISRLYDSTTYVDVNVTPTNKVGDDRITLTAVGTLVDPNVGENKPVLISGFLLMGEDAGNYLIPDAVSGTVTVNIYKADEPSISNPTVRTYYGNASAGNTINLAKLLPVDCGTTRYTVTSSNTLVTSSFVDGNGILTFATGTSECVAKEDITVKAEMQNYADATITVTIDFVEKTVPITKPSDSSSDVPITIPAQGKKPDQPITGTANISATGRVNGPARVEIYDRFVTDAITKAKSEAKTRGKIANGIAVELNVTMPKGSNSLNVTIPRKTLDNLVKAGVERFTINGTPVNLSFDPKTLKSIQKQTRGTVTIRITPVKSRSNGAKAIIGKRPIYDINVSYVKGGKTVTVSAFNGGNVTVAIPYTLGKNEVAGGLYAVYVDTKGKVTRIASSAYDLSSGCVIFTTNHFSLYGVGYTVPELKFTDISTHWFKDSIDYVVGRQLLTGTSETTFNPDTAITRELLVTALGRLSGVDTKLYTTNSFTDVRTDSSFRPYIEWAYKKGIIQDKGNDKFEPDYAITREEIAIIFANYAKVNSFILPVTREAITYEDASSIEKEYLDAVTAMQQAGIMMGGTGNKFNPKFMATRAEISAMLHRYIKLTIDTATAQGWEKSDAGQYLYFKDGVMVCDKWIELEGKWYYFNSDGSLAESMKIESKNKK